MSKDIYDVFEPYKYNSNAHDLLIVDWAVGSMCNFSCTYCDPLFYEGKTPWHDIDDCKRFIDFLWENVCIPQKKILYFAEKCVQGAVFLSSFVALAALRVLNNNPAFFWLAQGPKSLSTPLSKRQRLIVEFAIENQKKLVKLNIYYLSQQYLNCHH